MSPIVEPPARLSWKVLAMAAATALYGLSIYFAQGLLAEIKELRMSQQLQTEAVQQMRADQQNIVRELKLKTDNRYTLIDAKLWANTLAIRNPKIIVPEPIHVELPGESGR